MVEYLVPILMIENYASEVKKRANKRSNYNKWLVDTWQDEIWFLTVYFIITNLTFTTI